MGLPENPTGDAPRRPCAVARVVATFFGSADVRREAPTDR
jgi:hypothetical protein